jgi:hypothetical protein
MITYKQANSAIQKVFPNVKLEDTCGYLHIWSDHSETALKIAGMYENNLGVCKLNHCPNIETLVSWVKHLIESDRNKSFFQ